MNSINLSLEPKNIQNKFTDAGLNINSNALTSTMSFTTILIIGGALIVVTIFVGMLVSM